MKRILFICHGNICRSPMAEYIMKHIVEQNAVADNYYIASAATSYEEIGNPVYPQAAKMLAEHGIDCKGHHARKVEYSDYDKFDYIIGMDHYNILALEYVWQDRDHKISMLMDWTDTPHDVADPWYTTDFINAWNDIEKGCKALFNAISSKNQ